MAVLFFKYSNSNRVDFTMCRTFKNGLVSLLGWLALCLTYPLGAQDSFKFPDPEQDYSKLSKEEFGPLLDDVLREEQGLSECRVRLPVLNEIIRQAGEIEELRFLRDDARINCLVELQEFELAQQASLDFEAEYGSFDIWGGLFLAIRAEDPGSALTRLQTIAGDDFIETARSLDPHAFWQVANTIAKGGMEQERNAFFYEMVQDGRYLRFSVLTHDFIVGSAIEHAIVSGNLENAEALLSKLYDPNAFVPLLAYRKYDALWPAVEARVGENFALVTAGDRAKQQEKLADAPDDLEQLNITAHSILFDGDFEAAIGIADEHVARDNLAETITEDEAWVLNIRAYALDALGRVEEADSQFDFFQQFDPARYPWVVNFVINRASRLIGQARYEEGLAAASIAHPVARDYGSDYARALVARSQICGLAGIGKTEQAAALMPELRKHAGDNYALIAKALLCLNRDDEAAATLGEGLDDEFARDATLLEFLPAEFELFFTPSALRGNREIILARPELKARFEEHMRDVPKRFYPAASVRRAKNF